MVGSAVSLQLITMLVIGGTVSRLGPLIGVTIITFLPNLSQQMANIGPVVDGLLLVLFLRYLPDGIIGVPMVAINWISARLGLSTRLPSSVPAAIERAISTGAGQVPPPAPGQRHRSLTAPIPRLVPRWEPGDD